MSQNSTNIKLGLAGLSVVVIIAIGFFVWANANSEDKEDKQTEEDNGANISVSSSEPEATEPDSIEPGIESDSPQSENNNTTENNQLENGNNQPENNNTIENNQTTNDNNTTTEDTSEEVTQIDLDGFNYGYSQEEIRVEAGSTVNLTLTSSEGSHDWVVDEIEGANTEVVSAGNETQIEFTVPETAQGEEYEFYCSVGNHRELGMVGTLIVE